MAVGDAHIGPAAPPLSPLPAVANTDAAQRRFLQGNPLLSNDNPYLTALVATSAAVPVVAAMVTVASYVAPFPATWHEWIAVPLGAIITLVAWLLSALPCRRFASAVYANRCSYGSLFNQLRDVQSRLCTLDDKRRKDPENPLVKSDAYNIAFTEIATWCEDIERELKCRGLSWLLATGYINMWRGLHHAEEAMIEIEPAEAVLNKAIHDELCLQGSNMNNSEELLDKLRIAVKVLSVTGTRYLIKQPREQEADDDTESDSSQGQPAQSVQFAPSRRTVIEMEARVILREIRHTVNEYRDNRWEGLIHTRNRLMMMVIVTSFLAYVLLCLPVVNEVNPSYVITATVFFLVGAIVGLFNRLHLETQTSNAINDYGLSMARVIATPVLSGLAAVGSVLVFVLLANAIQSGLNITDKITDIYSISPLHIILAAVFGLTPNLLIGLLQQKAESYKSDIQSSKAS